MKRVSPWCNRSCIGLPWSVSGVTLKFPKMIYDWGWYQDQHMVKLELVLDIVGISHLSQAGLERCERVFGISATTKVYKRFLNCPIQQILKDPKKVWNPLWNPESCIFFMFLRKGRFQPSGWESPMEEHGQWAHLAVRAKVLDTTFGDHRRPADFWLQLNTVGQVVPYRPVLGQFNYHKSPKPQRLRIAAILRSSCMGLLVFSHLITL
jgi:hypothetical protein